MEKNAPILLGSEIYRGSSYGSWHPLRIPRVSTVLDLTAALGWRGDYLRSPRAKPAALDHWHTPDYLAALVQAERDGDVSAATRARHHIGTHANPVFAELWRRPATGAGGALLAAELLAQRGVVYHPGGGTHHALPDRANGFCYLNDPVLAILALRRLGARRVVYVDIDAHHCDGVEHGFATQPEVTLISVHEENRWPRTGALTDRGAGNLWNLPVPKALNDDEFALIRDALILPVTAAQRPDAVVLQCGADALADDPQSKLALSNGALWAVVAALRPLSPRYLVLGGGGYNPWSVGRAWTGVWATLAGIDIPDRLPPEATELLRALRWDGMTRVKQPLPHWLTTLRDAPRPGPIRPVIRDRLAQLGLGKPAGLGQSGTKTFQA